MAVVVGREVMVVGGGLAGVAAACTLAAAGRRVILLEKNGWLGGRAVAPPGSAVPAIRVYLGCCRSYQILLRQLGVAPVPVKQAGLRLAVYENRTVARLAAARLPTPFHLAPAFLRYPFLTSGDKWKITRGLAALVANKHTRASDSFATWLDRYGQSARARRYFWELFAAPALNAPAAEAAAGLAQMVFRLSLLGRRQDSAIFSPPLDAAVLQARVPALLAGSGGAVHLHTRVCQVTPTDAGFLVETSEGGAPLAAAAVVLALPPAEMTELLPAGCVATELQAAAALPGRPLVDAWVDYAHPVCTDEVMVIPGQPAVWIFAQKPAPAGRQRLLVSISCPAALSRAPAAAVETWIAGYLAQHLPGLQQVSPLAVQTSRHLNATFSPAPEYQAWRSRSPALASGLYMAGDWTGTGWPSTMESAVRSGRAAAQACLVAGT